MCKILIIMLDIDINKLNNKMAYFRNFGNVVSSHLFTKPNNLLLRSCNLPKILCESVDPSINHLHSAKALVQTISTLRNFEQNTEGQFKE